MRLFVATTFPEPVVRDLNDRVTKLRPRLPAASWVRPEAQHLTFAFLGEQEASLVDDLTPALTTALAATPRFDAMLVASGFFPNPRRPRVGWIGLEPEANFGTVARVVRDVVAKTGVQLDQADFKPHLTLMRIRDPWPPSSIDLFTKAMRDYRSDAFTVDTVTLYSSELNPNGAIHTAVGRFALRA
jgi:2'-5' RNA ligase